MVLKTGAQVRQLLPSWSRIISHIQPLKSSYFWNGINLKFALSIAKHNSKRLFGNYQAMSHLILFNKPYQVLCQFSAHENKTTLAEFIKIKDVYPAGRLDYDSEGLLLLTDDGKLQNQLASPKFSKQKIYWAQVEGQPTEQDTKPFVTGMQLKDGMTRPAQCKIINEPDNLWPRIPPIRVRKNIPDSWLEITLTEGRNRQVRRMCAAIGFPVLRLIRAQISDYRIDNLKPGEMKVIQL